LEEKSESQLERVYLVPSPPYPGERARVRALLGMFSTFNIQRSAFNVQRVLWTLNVGC
jgi:hypothetical protein